MYSWVQPLDPGSELEQPNHLDAQALLPVDNQPVPQAMAVQTSMRLQQVQQHAQMSQHRHRRGGTQVQTYGNKGGGACAGVILQVHLEDHTAVVLAVRLQQGLQNDAAGRQAPGMQVADQYLQAGMQAADEYMQALRG